MVESFFLQNMGLYELGKLANLIVLLSILWATSDMTVLDYNSGLHRSHSILPPRYYAKDSELMRFQFFFQIMETYGLENNRKRVMY